MNQNQHTLNGHGFFRKSKAYGLVCGIALGLAFLGGQVSADEVTTAEATPVTEQAATQTILEPASDDLTTAITQAEEAGVVVSQAPAEQVANQAEAVADYTNQAQDLAAITAQQEEINAQNAAITANNQVLTDAQAAAEDQANQTNQVVTHTPEEPTPSTPQDQEPQAPAPENPVTPATPTQAASVLPETGEAGSLLTVIGGVLLSGLGLAGTRKRKED